MKATKAVTGRRWVALLALLVGGAGLAGCHRTPTGAELGNTVPAGEVAWQAPDVASISFGDASAAAERGENLFAHTNVAASQYVGNGLTCGNCHVNNGTKEWAAPLVGVTRRYPAFSRRAGKTIDLKERIQECMVRSENGTPLPENGNTMNDLVAYMAWLSGQVPAKGKLHGVGLINVQPPAQISAARGAKEYATICSSCHGPNGQGQPPGYPPLWGPQSFNQGAGMANPLKMARFILKNMPHDNPGSLTVQQAFDIAGFVDSHARPALKAEYLKY